MSETENEIRTKYHFPWKLFVALMLVTFVPAIYQTFRVFFVVSGGNVESLDILGHIEWFDLINETTQAFLLVPLYYILSKFIGDKQLFASKITQTCVITFLIYGIFSVITYFSCLNIVSFMVTEMQPIELITSYLQLETISFAMGIIGSFFAIVYVLIGKARYIYAILIAKTVLIIIGDSILIPVFGINGVAYTNILINIVVAFVSILLLWYEGLLYLKFDKITDIGWIKEWVKVGFFSGATILLDNIIYTLIVCKMINDVAEVGNYWIANNFIWGWLLIPTIALSEIIRKECTNGCRRENIRAYLLVNVLILAVWLVTIPGWETVFTIFMGITNPAGILHILALLVPFYVFYNLSSMFDNIFYSMGKTLFIFITSIVVNIGYYGILYLLFLKGVFTANIEFVILLFGFGMIVHFLIIFLLYIYAGKKYGIVWVGGRLNQISSGD